MFTMSSCREENLRLESEYKELLEADSKTIETKATTAEAKSLRQQKQRLEARMTILEDHNRSLEF